MEKYKKPKSLEQAKVMKAYIEKYIITLTEYKESKNFDSVEDFETSIKKLDNLPVGITNKCDFIGLEKIAEFN